jgi:hypothetical protein
MIEQIGEIGGAGKVNDRPVRIIRIHEGAPAAFARTRAMNLSCWITALS